MNDFRKAATSTPELHLRIQQARQALEQARLASNSARARAAERTMNWFLDVLSERIAHRGSSGEAA
ncbi:hypothetical protein HFP15_29630 [Amycolatopsis sp. K13G38]|uniref:Uncharacterized protein n=1 Tax=Amycolatopsis acididurans TaxID=2724524 RepID=A0ABX1JBI1_9PSEU|nr:hypothetical protein [Amycolatopsis acididurans]NKQ57038.1 hypothetical protein [Amycolatopsis acididurans]